MPQLFTRFYLGRTWGPPFWPGGAWVPNRALSQYLKNRASLNNTKSLAHETWVEAGRFSLGGLRGCLVARHHSGAGLRRLLRLQRTSRAGCFGRSKAGWDQAANPHFCDTGDYPMTIPLYVAGLRLRSPFCCITEVVISHSSVRKAFSRSIPHQGWTTHLLPGPPDRKKGSQSEVGFVSKCPEKKAPAPPPPPAKPHKTTRNLLPKEVFTLDATVLPQRSWPPSGAKFFSAFSFQDLENFQNNAFNRDGWPGLVGEGKGDRFHQVEPFSPEPGGLDLNHFPCRRETGPLTPGTPPIQTN